MTLSQLGNGRQLRFECTRCGACCKRPGFVRLREGEAERIAAYLGLSFAQFRRRYLQLDGEGGWEIGVGEAGCPLLDGDLCSVEAVKPGQCASYPFWQELVEDRGAWKEEMALCEGMGRGPVFPPEEVRRLMALDPDSD